MLRYLMAYPKKNFSYPGPSMWFSNRINWIISDVQGKKYFLITFLASNKVLAMLGSWIGTCSVFFHSYSVSPGVNSERHKTHVCGINVPLYPESDWDQKSSQKSIRHDVWRVLCTTENAFLSYNIGTFSFWWEKPRYYWWYCFHQHIFNILFCTEIPIGFVLLPKNASRQKTFKIAYLTLTVQHRAWCKYQN
jgi:hypothetical protein